MLSDSVCNSIRRIEITLKWSGCVVCIMQSVFLFERFYYAFVEYVHFQHLSICYSNWNLLYVCVYKIYTLHCTSSKPRIRIRLLPSLLSTVAQHKLFTIWGKLLFCHCCVHSVYTFCVAHVKLQLINGKHIFYCTEKITQFTLVSLNHGIHIHTHIKSLKLALFVANVFVYGNIKETTRCK